MSVSSAAVADVVIVFAYLSAWQRKHEQVIKLSHLVNCLGENFFVLRYRDNMVIMDINTGQQRRWEAIIFKS